jgi:hypothetical protein
MHSRTGKDIPSHKKSSTPPSHTRRAVVSSALVGLGGSALLAATGVGSARAGTQAADNSKFPTRPNAKGGVLRNAGVGMHAGPDTAFGISTFTLNPQSVTCGVGSMGDAPGAVPGSGSVPTGLGSTGPFAMLMYATVIDSYRVDRAARQLVARGVMRSITSAAGQTMEDVEHDFICVGIDNRSRSADVFNLHFKTPFWSPASNPMATPSTMVKGWAMFGSNILLGEINVD